MTKRVIVPCESCKKKFVVKKPKKKIHNDGLEGRLTIYYISCRHCHKKYVSFVESEKLKTMINENKKVKRAMDRELNDDKYIELHETFESNFSKIESLTKDLIQRFAKYV